MDGMSVAFLTTKVEQMGSCVLLVIIEYLFFVMQLIIGYCLS